MTTVETQQLVRDQLVEFFGEERGERIVDAIAGRYRLNGVTLDVFVNLSLREAWRLEHGDTAAWDASARAAGFKPAIYERGRPILKEAPR